MWIPLTFILLFSTGFIAARFGVEDAEPFTLLLVRSVLVLPLLGAILLARRKPRQWSTAKARMQQMGVGMLLHGAYLGGVFAAINAGLPAGLTALLVSMHPLATAALSFPVFGIRLTARQWLGLACAAAGVILVLGAGVAGDTSGSELTSLSVVGLMWCIVSLVGISCSTLWQKRVSGHMGMVEGLVFQYIGAGIVFVIAAALVGSFRFTPSLQLVLTLTWLSIAISIGAIWLLMLMLERGEAHQVARLFFLVPPCAALMAYILFDEQWTLGMVIGALLVVAGLALDRPRAQTVATPHKSSAAYAPRQS